MELVLLRHGLAVDRASPDCPPDDASRPLTERGLRRTRECARGLAALGVAPDLLLSSPLRRALETAEIVREELAAGPVQSTPVLEPGRDPAELLALLAACDALAVLCVGHAPNLDLVLAVAIGVPGAPPTRLKKAGAALLELGPSPLVPGRLAWLLGPKVLRRLGRD